MGVKNAIGWLIWKIPTQQRTICDIDVEIIMFVVKESESLIVTPHWQE